MVLVLLSFAEAAIDLLPVVECGRGVRLICYWYGYACDDFISCGYNLRHVGGNRVYM